MLGIGLSQGLTYIMPIHYGWQWWPAQHGLVSGVIIGGAGLGAMVFDFISTALVNPDNVSQTDGRFPKEVYERTPGMIRICCACYTGVVLLATVLLFRRRLPKDPIRDTSIVRGEVDGEVDGEVHSSALLDRSEEKNIN